jgi:hypothetical protein
LSRVGRGLCDGLITRPKEFYRVSNKIRETSKRRPYPIRTRRLKERKGRKKERKKERKKGVVD